jgi:hypothetical protein
MEGFWTAQFKTPLGLGFGVAYFRDGKVFGGDSGYTYLGTYSEDQNRINAVINVAPFSPGVPSVFGSIGSAFRLNISATYNNIEAVGTGTADLFPNTTFGLKLTRVQ